MKRWVVAAAALAACAWSNSLYQARTLSNQARAAERDNLPGQAASLWGLVVSHAESAYARAPAGTRGAEALWLEGHARVKTSDCANAVAPLRGALALWPRAKWHDELLYELAGCEEVNQDPAAAATYGDVIATSSDPAVRRAARIRRGHVLVTLGRWDEALTALADDDTMPARIDRGLALAELGRGEEALAQLAPAIERGDSITRWSAYVTAFAAHDGSWTDSLLARLLTLKAAPEELRSAWILSAAATAADIDPDRTRARLRLLATRPPGRSVTAGTFLAAELELHRAPTIARLATLADSLSGVAERAEGVAEGMQLASLEGAVQRLLAATTPIRDGAARGDLVMFGAGEFARDSVGNRAISNWFFARIEHGWADSPYLPKALMARAALEPDSESALLARARSHADNPYILAALGDLGGQVRLVALEDSLGSFLRQMWTNPGTAPGNPAIRE